MANSIGVVSQATGSVTATSSDGIQRAISNGDAIFEGDVLSSSGSDSSANVTFNNGCDMSIQGDESALKDEPV